MIAKIAFMLRLLSSKIIATENAAKTPMALEKVVQMAVDLTGSKDTWQADEIMDNVHKNNPLAKWVLGLNLHNYIVSKNNISRNKYEIGDQDGDQGEDLCEVVSSSDDVGEDTDPETVSSYEKIMLQKRVKKAIPNHFLIKSPKVTDEIFLYDLIGKLTPEMFAEFFQCCYDIIHNSNFASILLDTIIRKAGEDPMEYYNFLDQYGTPDQRMIDEIAPTSVAKAIKNLLAWVRGEDLLKRHVEIRINTNLLGLTIMSCNGKEIRRILDQLEYKLRSNIPIYFLWIWNVDFSRDESPFSHIRHKTLYHATRIRFDNCIFKDKMFSVIKKGPISQASILTIEEYQFLERIKQLRIIRCKIKGIDDSLKLLRGLSLLSVSGFKFEHVPELIYQMKNLVTLKLKNGKLYDISEGIQNLNKLKSLNLSQNKLESIPASVTNMERLVKLAVGNNNITKISNSMGNMKSLAVLILDENNINADECCTDLKIPGLVNLSMKKCMLTKLPEFVKSLVNLKELICTMNRIKRLDNWLHTHLKKLEIVVLSKNALATIPATLGNMQNLKILIVGGSTYSGMLNIDTFSAPPGLRKLVLQNCESKTGIPEWVFKLHSLIEMCIINCNVEIVPSQIAKLKNLVKLKLARCSLLRFPEEVVHLPELKFLHLGQNPDIKAIPPCINRLQKLDTLIIYDSGLVGELCAELCQLTKLEHINISNNFITGLPEEIGNLELVKIFRLNCNPRLERLPNSIGNMHSLVILNIGNCNLESLPDTIGNLKLLREIDIGMNRRITKLPESIGCLSLLRKARLHEMGLSMSIQQGSRSFRDGINQYPVNKAIPDAFFNLSKLRELSLARNSRLHCVPELLVKLRCLRTIDIGKCGLRKLPDAIYRLLQLQELKAGLNCISELSENIGNLKHLKVLILSLNHLKWLPSSLRELHKLEIFDLKRNKFTASYLNNLIILGGELRMHSLKSYYWLIVPSTDEHNHHDDEPFQVKNCCQYPEASGIPSILSNH